MFKLIAPFLLASTSAFGAGKDYVPAYTLVSAVTMATDITSSTVDARGWDNVDFELVVTGTPTGSFFVDCGLLPAVPPGRVTPVWVALGLSPTPGVTGAASNLVIEINQTGCPFLRLRYVAGSSTGTLTAYVSEKQL